MEQDFDTLFGRTLAACVGKTIASVELPDADDHDENLLPAFGLFFTDGSFLRCAIDLSESVDVYFTPESSESQGVSDPSTHAFTAFERLGDTLTQQSNPVELDLPPEYTDSRVLGGDVADIVGTVSTPHAPDCTLAAHILPGAWCPCMGSK